MSAQHNRDPDQHGDPKALRLAHDYSAAAAMTSIVRMAVVVITLVLFLGSLVNVFTGQRELAVIFAFGTPLGVAAWGFVRTGHPEASVALLCFVLVSIVTVVLALDPLGVHDVALMAYGGVVLFGALFLSRRFFFGITALVFIAVVAAFLIERYGLSRSVVARFASWSQLGEALAILAVFAIVGRHAAETFFGSLGAAHAAARRDELTGFENRAAFLATATSVLDKPGRSPGYDVVVLADFDNFRRVNTLIGHWAADKVMAEAAKRMIEATGSYPRGRIGDDEFAVLAAGLQDDKAAAELAQAAHGALNFEHSGVTVRCSVGYAATQRNGEGVEPLMRAAETALAEAKQGGGARLTAANARHI